MKKLRIPLLLVLIGFTILGELGMWGMYHDWRVSGFVLANYAIVMVSLLGLFFFLIAFWDDIWGKK